MITGTAVTQMSQLADRVHVDPAILSYVSQLAAESRQLRNVRLGLSVRGCLAYVRAAKTWAAADGRGFVVPGRHQGAGRAGPRPPAAARRGG